MLRVGLFWKGGSLIERDRAPAVELQSVRNYARGVEEIRGSSFQTSVALESIVVPNMSGGAALASAPKACACPSCRLTRLPPDETLGGILLRADQLTYTACSFLSLPQRKPEPGMLHSCFRFALCLGQSR